MERVLRWQGSTDESEQTRSIEPGARATTAGGGGDGLAPVCIGVVDGPLRAEIARTYLEQAGITILAVRRADGQMVVNPTGEVVLNADDTLIALGTRADLERMADGGKMPHDKRR